MDSEQKGMPLGQPDLVEQINLIASAHGPVVITGPDDPDRQWMAELLHDLGLRNERPFLVISCIGSVNGRSLVELSWPVRTEFSELARLVDHGAVQSLGGGTVLLNNLPVLNADLQSALTELVSVKLGSRLIIGRTRITAGRPDHAPVAEMAGQQLFPIPLIRNKQKTIHFFLNYFLAKTNLEWQREVPGFDEEATGMLADYAWPHNLSELRNVVRQSVLFSPDGVPVPAAILPAVVRNYQSQDPLFLKKAVLRAEYDLICKTLFETRNNKRKAAELLHISRKTLYSKLRLFQDGQNKSPS